MKKIISLIIILCMILIHPSAIATDTTKSKKTLYATQDLFEIGIMKGDAEGNLNAEKLVTRAEFVALLTRVMAENVYKGSQCFNDVSTEHWAADYITFVTDNGIIEGYGNGCFGPDDTVTFAQAVKMLLTVLGHTEKNFSYPMDYMMTAARCGLTDGINIFPDSHLSREEAAMLILNALYIPKKESGSLLLDKLSCKTYYVSPDGDDDGEGTSLSPWKTLKKAAEEADGYAIIYLENGVYYENHPTVFLGNGENVDRPLIVKPRNGAAVEIVYDGTEDYAITIPQGRKFITIENISLTANGGSIKIENADNITLKNNHFFGGEEAICIINGNRATVSANMFEEQSVNCINISGESQQAQIFNNEFILPPDLETAALILGNDTISEKVKECIIWNNVIYDESENTGAVGVLYQGTDKCQFYNNIIDGTEGGVKFVGENIHPILKNNIYSECSDNAYIYENVPKSIESDYNCFYQSYPQVKEKNSKFSNPYFVSRGTDWRLMSISPAAGSGEALSSVITYADGDSVELDMNDFDGNKRGEKWHMGIYSTLSSEKHPEEDLTLSSNARVLLNLDFRKDSNSLITSGGDWKTASGLLWQESTDKARTTICYENGVEWTDYEYSADVESAAAVEGNASGIIFRSDIKMQNMYTFRFLSNDMLEFAKWQNNSFASIEKWEYRFNTDTIYNLKVKAVGNKFTFYVNGEKVKEIQDNSYLSGTVGLYCYREINRYDNMKVVSAN